MMHSLHSFGVEQASPQSVSPKHVISPKTVATTPLSLFDAPKLPALILPPISDFNVDQIDLTPLMPLIAILSEVYFPLAYSLTWTMAPTQNHQTQEKQLAKAYVSLSKPNPKLSWDRYNKWFNCRTRVCMNLEKQRNCPHGSFCWFIHQSSDSLSQRVLPKPHTLPVTKRLTCYSTLQ
ncbi:hypothetical protein BLNAU_15312 [Blattamonas nauphoetae]|uniref:C3H1-type domain-containing protein n=1 Tax=Blattamonas nauphoetae TaxID=2049346 RepID=A0ABQ9XB81_9EUKA|nr:hypothetical protein BLNAU_15312 [Blattamonas nauphoetae]